jgi:hypothetical protein
MPLARRSDAVTLASLLKLGRDVLINIAIPFLIYSLAQPRFGDMIALIGSSAPPIIRSVIEFARNRRVDALSALVLLGIALSLLAVLGGGSVRFLQLREKLVTILIGVVFLGSAAVGRPLMYELIRAYLTRAGDPDAQMVESLKDDSHFRGGMTIMTLVWGAGLLADAAVSIALLYVLSIRAYLVVNTILGYATIGSLTFWNIWFGRRRRRQREARTAAASVRCAPAAQADAPGAGRT